MSGRRVPAVTDGRLATSLDWLPADAPVSIRTLAGLLAFVPVAASTLYRVGNNAPGTLSPPLTDVAAVALPVAIVGPALAALLLATTADSSEDRVGLAFAGGFGLIALASTAAWVPAAIGVVAGGTGIAWSRLRRLVEVPTVRTIRRGTVVVLLTAAVAVSLAATAGVDPAGLRPLGTGLLLVGVGLTPVFVGGDRASLVVGALAGVVTVALATSVPYVAGAVLLVGGGVVGAPLGLVAFAVAGGVAGCVAALRTGKPDAAVATALLLVAGVPGTLLRALGVVVALALLAGPRGGALR